MIFVKRGGKKNLKGMVKGKFEPIKSISKGKKGERDSAEKS